MFPLTLVAFSADVTAATIIVARRRNVFVVVVALVDRRRRLRLRRDSMVLFSSDGIIIEWAGLLIFDKTG